MGLGVGPEVGRGIEPREMGCDIEPTWVGRALNPTVV